MISARGFVRKKSGEFGAAVVLEFASPIQAQNASASLKRGWERGQRQAHCLAWLGTPEEFEKMKEELIAYGADPERLEVLKRPGEKFSILIPNFPKSWTNEL